jgi:hypothetical protein
MQHPPTEKEIRAALIERAKECAELTGKTWSEMSRDALGDSKFLHEASRGRNFTVTRYQKMMRYFDRTLARRNGKT